VKTSTLSGAILALAVAMGAQAASVGTEAVPLYTGEDLDRMFGPVPAGPSVPCDKTTPEDWRWVEQFIDRQYARVDADRQYDLDRHALDIAAGREEPAWTGYGQPLAWGLGYPASTWWNNVWGHYAAATSGGYRVQATGYRNPYARAMGETTRPVRENTRSSGNAHGHGGGNAGGHGHRSK
jgi:hypothetical protein